MPVLILLLLLGLACSPSPAVQPQPKSDPPPRQPAQVLGYEGGADWLEREGRAEDERPEIVLRAMNLKDGDVVADLGAGTGFYSRRLARAVAPTGKVWANDIQPEMLDRLKELAAKEGVTNVVTVVGTETDPKLPRAAFDWILLVDVYHEFQQPEPMLAKIREALKPGGRVALVEYRAEGDTAAHIHASHKMSVEQVLAEWVPAGFVHVETREELPTQHLFIFSVAP
ncbi:MAG TPA: class I SAM-dependent methyltransferase [Thermoanaerobaculia bacterium]|nr:class I SAM-dependent methyltransferase [Thermoanaerobaculia bacterium]